MSKPLYINNFKKFFLLSILLISSFLITSVLHAQNDSLPDFEKRNFGFGFHLCFGYGANTGSFARYYTPKELSMTAGVDLIYNKSLLSFNITSNRHRIKEPYVGAKTFEESAGVDIINLVYGYSVVDRDHFVLTPFAGAARVEFSTYSHLNAYLIEKDYNFVLGFSAGYKYRKKVKFASSSRIPINRHRTSIVNARVLMTRVNFYDDFEGYLFHFTLGFALQYHGVNVIQ